MFIFIDKLDKMQFHYIFIFTKFIIFTYLSSFTIL